MLLKSSWTHAIRHLPAVSSVDLPTRGGGSLHVTVLYNPSHLEVSREVAWWRAGLLGPVSRSGSKE